MRIIYYYKDYATPMYQWQHVHIFEELARHGCKIEVFNPLEFENFEQANEKLIDYIKKEKVDLFMTPHSGQELYANTVKEIKKTGIPTLLICFDNLVVPFVHLDVANHYDLVWLTSQETKYMFDMRGCNTIFLPYAANPYLVRGKEEVEGIGFVGTPYGSRANLINKLTKNGIPVYCHCKKNEQFSKVESVRKFSEKTPNKLEIALQFVRFSQGRKILMGYLLNKLNKTSELKQTHNLHMEYAVSPYDLYKVYPKYTLALSSTTARNTGVLRHPLHIVNLRSFEIPMSGGIQFCQYFEELTSYFENGKEIIMYTDDNDLLEKAKFYNLPKNKELRNKIREQARNRAVAEHTWWNRFTRVFDSLCISRN